MNTRADLGVEVKFIPALSLVAFGSALTIRSGSGWLEEEDILQICVRFFKRALDKNALKPHLQQTRSASRELILRFQKENFQ